MFSAEHILYIVFSILAVVALLILMSKAQKPQYKKGLLIFWAVVCYALHVSTVYITLFNGDGQTGTLNNYHLLPIFFCNSMMRLLVVVAFWPNKESRFFRFLATFVAYGGFFGGIITTIITPPQVAVFLQFKAALAHTTMMLASVYLFVGGFVKINVFNLIPFACGLLYCGVAGGLTELIYYLNGLPSPNAMYLVHGPAEAPFFKCWMFALAFLAIIFAFTALWEHFTKQPQDRWYNSNADLKELIAK